MTIPQQPSNNMVPWVNTNRQTLPILFFPEKDPRTVNPQKIQQAIELANDTKRDMLDFSKVKQGGILRNSQTGEIDGFLDMKNERVPRLKFFSGRTSETKGINYLVANMAEHIARLPRFAGRKPVAKVAQAPVKQPLSLMA
jgi:hypothetical protein